ncbi:hypothetical protein P9294_gp012 [Bacillus phage FADO]|uniref:Uncharacterized protein n=1 Tax=Bacillus phage FADO TaxID=2917160 RepID=A0AAE9K6I4_9CAUD|nr:hypothetical protein P9294_gp012 [Bacillus phage FADO]UNY48727.1 hypothetical protein fado_12 [Bacillus phage FADO]
MNIHYYVDFDNKKIKKCILLDNDKMIQFFDMNGDLEKWKQSYNKNNLFKTEKEAEERFDNLTRLYGHFKYKPFLKEEILRDNLTTLMAVEFSIDRALSDYPNFDGIDFCDVSAGGIQIRGHHKEIKGYTYGGQPTIKYDFSNYVDCVSEFVEMWKELDTPSRVKSHQEFLADGEKYGWD